MRTRRTQRELRHDFTFMLTASCSFFRRPKVAILCEQGVSRQTEMAWAFTAAGFDAVEVPMSDVVGTRSDSVRVAHAACGGQER